MKIYVVGSSKNKFLPLDDIREKFLIDEKHEGDNIDFLNPWYCELTGLYYLWKHVDDDIVGLEHYRRYFVNSKNKLLSESEIKNLLQKNDIICHHLRNYTKYKSIEEELIKSTKDEHTVKTFKNYIKEIDNTYDMNKEPYKHSFNMFIGKRNIIESILEKLFEVMNNFIVKYDIRKINKRTIGYLSEFYFSYLITQNKFIEVDVFNQKFNRLA